MALETETLSNSVEGAEDYTQETEEEDFSDESSDSKDSEGEVLDFAAVPKAFEQVVPRSLKRTYGVLVDDLISERRLKNAKLDKQLEFLRSIIPSTWQRDLNELVEEVPPAEPRETPPAQSSLPPKCVTRQQPMVEVARKEGKMEVRIVCLNRPGLMADIIGALESNMLTVLQASIACHHDTLFESLSLENEEETINANKEWLEAEEEVVKGGNW